MKTRSIVLGLAALVASAATFAGDPAAGKAKATVCATCHGADGIAIAPTYPNLKGQNEAYMVSALKAYRGGQRQGGLSAVMTPMAKPLSDEDIANLAAYYASL